MSTVATAQAAAIPAPSMFPWAPVTADLLKRSAIEGDMETGPAKRMAFPVPAAYAPSAITSTHCTSPAAPPTDHFPGAPTVGYPYFEQAGYAPYPGLPHSPFTGFPNNDAEKSRSASFMSASPSPGGYPPAENSPAAFPEKQPQSGQNNYEQQPYFYMPWSYKAFPNPYQHFYPHQPPPSHYPSPPYPQMYGPPADYKQLLQYAPQHAAPPPFFRDDLVKPVRKSAQPFDSQTAPAEAIQLSDVCDMKSAVDLAKITLDDPESLLGSSGSLSIASRILEAESRLCFSLLSLRLNDPVAYIYNPLDYARDLHHKYVLMFGSSEKKIMFLGMNPGPFGMAQNGVPFGDSHFVRNFLKIDKGAVRKPVKEHPKRPIWGLDCPQREVSGSRFWGLIQAISGNCENFFQHSYVYNYCPLVFLGMSGKNLTPPSLSSAVREPLLQACDRALLDVISVLRIQRVVAVGRFVEERTRLVLKNAGRDDVAVDFVMHPSPINPKANAGWDGIVRDQLEQAGVASYFPYFHNPIATPQSNAGRGNTATTGNTIAKKLVPTPQLPNENSPENEEKSFHSSPGSIPKTEPDESARSLETSSCSINSDTPTKQEQPHHSSPPSQHFQPPPQSYMPSDCAVSNTPAVAGSPVVYSGASNAHISEQAYTPRSDYQQVETSPTKQPVYSSSGPHISVPYQQQQQHMPPSTGQLPNFSNQNPPSTQQPSVPYPSHGLPPSYPEHYSGMFQPPYQPYQGQTNSDPPPSIPPGQQMYPAMTHFSHKQPAHYQQLSYPIHDSLMNG